MKEKAYTTQDVIDFSLHVQSKDFNESVKTYDLFEEWSKDRGFVLWEEGLPSRDIHVGNRRYSKIIIFYYKDYDGKEEFGAGVYRGGWEIEDYISEEIIDWDSVVRWRYV